uniref:Uncharacterized protein n=1 Tax=Arundo donax TaxID=35708 RepID=A0A0A8YN51_ARUDO
MNRVPPHLLCGVPARHVAGALPMVSLRLFCSER